ncbi:MAG: ATP-binding cassette domain-containing protein [Spirochaetales bacterium]|nr:ATP-binding cassette domain-containing protein [Spirochaetales bacterium]
MKRLSPATLPLFRSHFFALVCAKLYAYSYAPHIKNTIVYNAFQEKNPGKQKSRHILKKFPAGLHSKIYKKSLHSIHVIVYYTIIMENNKIIEVNNLKRYFKILKRQEGLWGAVKDLFSRNYQTIKAVDDISFSVEKGEIVGFIGPNGAGKSTTIKMLTGVLKETAGTVVVDSYIPFRDRKKYVANIGVVLGQRSQLWWNIPVIESFKVLKDIYRITDAVYNRSLKLFNDLVDLKQYYHIPVRKLSLGQKTLCNIASAFLHSPKLIFLDEPTIGLDVSIKKNVRKIIRTLNKELDTTIIVTTHDVGDIENLCKRLILIDKGKIIFDGLTSHFNQTFGAYRTLRLDIEHINDGILSAMEEQVNNQFRYKERIAVKLDKNGWVKLTIDQDELPLLDVLNFATKTYRVKDVKIEEISLEDVIIRAYEGALE